MRIAVSAGIVGSTPRPDLGPVRLARVNDIVRLFGETGWHASPALVAAALALMNGVPRVVVAAAIAALPPEATIVALPGPVPLADRLALRAPPGGVLLVDLAPDVTPAEVLAARVRGVRFVAPTGSVVLPGLRRAIAVGGAALALPLQLGQTRLGALVELGSRAATSTPEGRALVDGGLLVLATQTPPRSGPRVGLPPGERPIAARDEPDEPAASGPTAHLEAALNALAGRFSHRLGRDAGALATLEREAERLLQAEVSAGVITGYGLTIEPVGADLAIEVAVSLPRRVGRVIIRLGQT